MKHYFIVILLAFGFYSCSPIAKRETVYYIYNSKSIFKYQQISHDSDNYLYFVAIKVFPVRLGLDSVASSRYTLIHFLNHGSYQDTSFTKHKSYIDSIDFYGTEWLKKKENLDKFWTSSRGWPDSLKIYLFEPIPGTDSLVFRRVHRYYDVSD